MSIDLVIGEALEAGLFTSLRRPQVAAVIAALAADEDRDYGELELDDELVTTLAKFEDIAYKVSTEEWQHGIEPAPELNFSAAATCSAMGQWALNWHAGCGNSGRGGRSRAHAFPRR